MSQQVALLGLGTMGIGMARNLLKAGFPLTVYNRTKEKAAPLGGEGATVASTPAEAANGADVVLTMLSDDDASRAAWLGDNGALARMRPGALAIECSTVSPEWVAELHAEATKRDVTLLDAPVTGSRVQAEAGQLIFLVGGDADVLERARTVLQAMSKQILHLGPVGSGTQLKLINNFLCGVQVASLAEAMTWIERNGLDRDAALQFLKTGNPGSPLFTGISERMTKRTYEVNFLLKLMAKDLRYARAAAANYNVPLATAQTSEELFQEAQEQGHAEQDMSAVVEVLRAKSAG